MNVAHVLAARPNFIKAAPVVNEFNKKGHSNYIIHTNQHYDYLMSAVFSELFIPEPDAHLGIGSGLTQTNCTSFNSYRKINKKYTRLCYSIRRCKFNYFWSIGSCKLNIPVVHIESGCRSFNDSVRRD